jgi:hypothetical protein
MQASSLISRSRLLTPAASTHTRTRTRATVATCRHHNRRGQEAQRTQLTARVTPAQNRRGAAVVTAAEGSGGSGDDGDKKDETVMSGLARKLVERKYDPEARGIGRC